MQERDEDRKRFMGRSRSSAELAEKSYDVCSRFSVRHRTEGLKFGLCRKGGGNASVVEFST